jgi:hypothetical protein
MRPEGSAALLPARANDPRNQLYDLDELASDAKLLERHV